MSIYPCRAICRVFPKGVINIGEVDSTAIRLYPAAIEITALAAVNRLAFQCVVAGGQDAVDKIRVAYRYFGWEAFKGKKL